jgi:hypothetical protein
LLIDQALFIWEAGIELTHTPKDTPEYIVLNTELLKASGVFTNLKSKFLSETTTKVPRSSSGANKLIQLIEKGISRYYIEGLYDLSNIINFQLSVDGLEEWTMYEDAIHDKIEELSMIQQDGKWIQSKSVRNFTPLEVPEYGKSLCNYYRFKKSKGMNIILAPFFYY